MLNVKNLEISFNNTTPIIKGITFSLVENNILGVVGESGSGKSISSLAILGLLPKNANIKGEILFKQQNILS